MIEQEVRHLGGVAGHEVDDARREAGRLEDLHDVVRAQHRTRGRLPDDGAAHERGRARQVAADGGEVERRDRVDEAFEAAVVGLIPDRVAARRLLVVELLREADVEAPEVDQLAGRIDLRLVHRLRLAEHRRGIERHAPRRGEQLGGTKEHRRAILPAPVRPVASGRGSRTDRQPHFLGASLVVVGQHMRMLVRHHRLPGLAGPHFLSADHQRNIDALARHRRQPRLDGRALGCSGCIGEIGIVGRGRNTADTVKRHGVHCRTKNEELRTKNGTTERRTTELRNGTLNAER